MEFTGIELTCWKEIPWLSLWFNDVYHLTLSVQGSLGYQPKQCTMNGKNPSNLPSNWQQVWSPARPGKLDDIPILNLHNRPLPLNINVVLTPYKWPYKWVTGVTTLLIRAPKFSPHLKLLETPCTNLLESPIKSPNLTLCFGQCGNLLVKVAFARVEKKHDLHGRFVVFLLYR